MEMNDNQLKRLLQESMEWEADQIMEEVNSDPEIKDAVAPKDMRDNIYQQIYQREGNKEKSGSGLSAEEQELIRLGKIYKKKRGRRKYIVLVAAVLCALGVGTISFGDGKKVFSEMKRMLGDREQTVVNSGNGDNIKARDVLSEEEAYQKIEQEFGLWPVRLYYVPEGMDFEDAIVEEESQSARIYYADGAEKLVSYYITTNHREGSASTDVEDGFVQEYQKEINGVIIQFREYQVEENEVCRWCIDFTHGNAQYSIIMTGIEQEEVEQIAENLFFS